jgi:hypothetical protein
LINAEGDGEYVDANIITLSTTALKKKEWLVLIDENIQLIKFRKPIKEQVSTLSLSKKRDRVVLSIIRRICNSKW